jgi:ATP-binding cassette, subfamily B, bacterial PglK
MIISSLSEIISIGAILPFIGILTAPEQIYQHQLIQPVIQYFELTSPIQLMMPLTITFILSALLAGALRITLLYATTRFSFATGADLSINIYRRTLYQDYSVHVGRNSSEVINGIITKTNHVIHGVLYPLLILVSSMFLLTGIMLALVSINILVAVSSSVVFGILYWAVIRYTRRQLKENSKCIADKSTQMIKSLQEGLGGVRDVLLDGSQNFYCELYKKADLPLRRATGNNLFIAGSPRYAMEALGISLIACLAFIMMQRDDLLSAIPVLGALALGAQRLLPALQQAYSSYSTLKGSKSSFEDVLTLLSQPLPRHNKQTALNPIQFEKHINLKNITFRYSEDAPWVLKNINLKIRKGTRIGIKGVTGCGKSTLIDLIMGLLLPTKGDISIDGQLLTSDNKRFWQKHISHVPQNIYLSDSTIEENIAFGIPKEQISKEQVRYAAKQANILESIEQWQKEFQTFVGERGIKLSGGQRQRIGIARALYKQSKVLILDEGTSALDSETEKKVMKEVQMLNGDLTIIIIAHRLTTLADCDQVYELTTNGLHLK